MPFGISPATSSWQAEFSYNNPTYPISVIPGPVPCTFIGRRNTTGTGVHIPDSHPCNVTFAEAELDPDWDMRSVLPFRPPAKDRYRLSVVFALVYGSVEVLLN